MPGPGGKMAEALRAPGQWGREAGFIRRLQPGEIEHLAIACAGNAPGREREEGFNPIRRKILEVDRFGIDFGTVRGWPSSHRYRR